MEHIKRPPKLKKRELAMTIDEIYSMKFMAEACIEIRTSRKIHEKRKIL